jgi:hypothetical protein
MGAGRLIYELTIFIVTNPEYFFKVFHNESNALCKEKVIKAIPVTGRGGP